MEVGSRKRVLLISGVYPANPRVQVHGIFQRLRLFAEALAATHADLNMLFFINPDDDRSEDEVRKVESTICREWGITATVNVTPFRRAKAPSTRIGFYLAPAFSVERQRQFSIFLGPEQVAAVRYALGNKPDLVFAHRLLAMLPCLATDEKLPPIFFDLDDIEHRLLVRSLITQKTWFGDKLRILHAPALMHAERRAIKTATTTFVCSPQDRDYLSVLYNTRRVEVVPNTTRLQDVPDKGLEEPVILFVGAFGHPPNSDAAERLVTKVYPLILAAIPEARVVIVGNKPEEIPSFHTKPVGVEFAGFVENLGPLYARAAIACCPIVFGAGTRIKILEAAGYGKAIVATRLAAEGLEFKDGHEIVLRDSSREMADACIDLIRNPGKRQALGSAARDRVASSYERSRIIERISQTFRTALDAQA